MATGGSAGDCWANCLKPLNRHNLLHFYGPAVGAVGYTTLSVNILSPVVLKSVFKKQDLTNILLFHTLTGTGMYLFTRKHVQSAAMQQRIMYSVYGSVMFGFGSILFWAVTCSILPENWGLRTLFALFSSTSLLQIGKHYLSHIDSQVSKLG